MKICKRTARRKGNGKEMESDTEASFIQSGKVHGVCLDGNTFGSSMTNDLPQRVTVVASICVPILEPNAACSN